MDSESTLHQRDPELFQEELKVILQRLTINETPKVVGSTAYAEHKYPSDVDVFERVQSTLGKNDALRFYADHFARVAQIIIMDSDEMVFSDFKAGEDSRFSAKAWKEYGGSIVAYLSYLRSNGLLNESEFEEASQTITNSSDNNKSDTLDDALREYRVLRWSLAELVNKEKHLRDGKVMTLEKALSMPTIVKIDVFTWYSGRWQSIEVFYNLSYRATGSGSGRNMRKTVEFNPMGSYVQGLLEDIEKYSSTSPLKVIKRMWSLARVTDCEDMLQALSPALGSNAAALNQVAGDMEMIWELVDKKVNASHITRVFIELVNFGKRLAPHLSAKHYQQFQSISSQWFETWYQWKATSEIDKGQLASSLKKAYALLQEVIKAEAGPFLDKVGQMNITCKNPRFQNL